MRDQLLQLQRAETRLEEEERIIQHSLKTLAEARENTMLAYVTHKDLRSLDCFRNKTLFAFKAPSGAELDVPSPESAPGSNRSNYKLYLRSIGRGPIDAVLICHGDEDQSEEGAISDAAPPSSKRLRLLGEETALVVGDNASADGDGPTRSAGEERAAEAGAKSGNSTVPRTTGSNGNASASATPADMHGAQVVRLSPPPVEGDYVYQMHGDEGVADLFDLHN